MGYFSQKKKHQRENNFLFISALVVGGLAFLLIIPALGDKSLSFLTKYLFQFYIAGILVLAYALWLGRWAYSAFFGLCLLIIYICLSSYANLFFNSSVDDRHHMQLVWQADQPLSVSGRGMVLQRSGHLNLGSGVLAPFATYEKNLQVYTVIGVNFQKLDSPELAIAFERLKTFITMQDDPVIVYGSFGVPAWAPLMKDFLLATDLKVKNRLLLTDRHRRFAPLAVPQFYILAFKNIGITDLKTVPPTAAAPFEIRAELGFY